MANDNILILRSAYGKVGLKYFLNPVRDPRTGRFPDCVKHVDSKGDMILTEEEKNSGRIFVPENRVYIIEDGKTFDLNNPYDEADWHAIQFCPLIATSRDQRDKAGNLVIDGNAKRYGSAELYIERPGFETNKRVSKRKLIHQAESYIINDPKGSEGHLKMARLLGRPMKNAPHADVEDFLMSMASKDPNTIINLYTSDEANLRLLFMDARDANIIYLKNKFYMYGEQGIVLGATDDAVITWMRNPTNRKLLEMIKRDTYPEYWAEDKKESLNDSLTKTVTSSKK